VVLLVLLPPVLLPQVVVSVKVVHLYAQVLALLNVPAQIHFLNALTRTLLLIAVNQLVVSSNALASCAALGAPHQAVLLGLLHPLLVVVSVKVVHQYAQVLALLNVHALILLLSALTTMLLLIAVN
jgi:hypothetical protein